MSGESVVLPSTTTSNLSLSLHPLPILNISEHLTRIRLQNNKSSPFIVGGLLGTQNGREVEIVNTFELAAEERKDQEPLIDHAFLQMRREQYKAVFPSLEFIGWYTVSPLPTASHIALQNQFTAYSSNPLLLILQSGVAPGLAQQIENQALPIKVYEPTVELRERKSRSMFIEVGYKVETGEAERIAVDWTSKGGAGGGSLVSHLQNQRSAIQMLHTRIDVVSTYVEAVLKGEAPNDYATLRSIQAMVAGLPANEHKTFREEFDQEYADVQLTAFLSTLTKSANVLNDLVDKYAVMTGHKEDDRRSGPRMGPRRPGRMGGGGGFGFGFGMGGDNWDRGGGWDRGGYY